MATVLSRRSFIVLSGRGPVCSSAKRLARFRPSPPPPQLKEIGVLGVPVRDLAYEPGQLFIHKTFAYRGVLITSSPCLVKVKKKTTELGELAGRGEHRELYYQALIHRPDWAHMKLPIDLTAYLSDSGPRGERLLTALNGIDCVAHTDILPYLPLASTPTEYPVEHDLFSRLFALLQRPGSGESVWRMKPDLAKVYQNAQRSWQFPQSVSRETTDGVEAELALYYLGATGAGSANRHVWRYTIRLTLLDPAILEGGRAFMRERALKVFSLNNMNNFATPANNDRIFELSAASPAFQFSSTIELLHLKGAHMWGHLKMERDNGALFDVNLPAVELEAQHMALPDSTAPSSAPPPSSNPPQKPTSPSGSNNASTPPTIDG